MDFLLCAKRQIERCGRDVSDSYQLSGGKGVILANNGDDDKREGDGVKEQAGGKQPSCHLLGAVNNHLAIFHNTRKLAGLS